MGLNSPRISLGASGFMSKVSRCEDPPLCHTRMQEISLLVPARSTLSSVIPSDPSEPRRSRSRRPKRLVWLFTFIDLMIVQKLLRIQQRPEDIFQASPRFGRFRYRLPGCLHLFGVGITGDGSQI